MTPAHAYFYVHIIHVLDKFLHYAALRTSRASLKVRTDCKLFNIHVTFHLPYMITALCYSNMKRMLQFCNITLRNFSECPGTGQEKLRNIDSAPVPLIAVTAALVSTNNFIRFNACYHT